MNQWLQDELMRSEGCSPPGQDLARLERIEHACEPVRNALARVIGVRVAGVSCLVMVLGCTPEWFGVPRRVKLGILHHRDARLADLSPVGVGMHSRLETSVVRHRLRATASRSTMSHARCQAECRM